MKQHTPITKELNGYKFYIRPFPAFTAAHMSGELVSILGPSIGGVIPIAMAAMGNRSDVMNLDASAMAGAMGGLSGLNGPKVESLLKKLLTTHMNISVEIESDDPEQTKSHVKLLDNDLANEVFCGAAQDMFILAVEVINVNYNGFFKKLADQFGLRKAASEKSLTPEDTDD